MSGQVDTALLTAGTAHVLLTDFSGGSAGALPTYTQLSTFASAGTLPTNYVSLGHTSQDNLLTPGQDGGDVTTSGSWQKKVLKTTQAPVVESFTIPSIQLLDNDVLNYYYGGGDATGTDKWVGPANPAPIEKRVVVVFIDDGTKVAGLWWPKASITRADAMTFALDKPTEIPLKFTRLDQTGQPPFVWINDQLGA